MRRFAILAAAASTVLVAGVLAVAGQAQAATGLTASFHVDSTWQGAYQGTYTITNNTAGTVTGWNVQFDLPSGSSIGNWWNANLATSGQHVTATNQDWNKSIAKGATASFGFLVNGTGMPQKCAVNGGSCSGGPIDNTPPSTPGGGHVPGNPPGTVSPAWTDPHANLKVTRYNAQAGAATTETVTNHNAP